MVKYLDALEISKELGKNVFNRFCQYLSVRNRWLVDELQAELNSLRGELQLEKYIHRESELIVLKEYEKITRLSDGEKKDLVTLVATRAQLYKETFKKRLHEGAQRLEELRSNHARLTQYRDSVVGNILKFFRINRARLRNKDLADAENGPVGVVVRELLDLSAEYLGDWNKVKKEKANALNVLKSNNVSAKLDLEAEEVLDPVDKELEQLQNQLAERRKETVRLQEQLESIRRERALEELASEKELASCKEAFEDVCRNRKELGGSVFKLQVAIKVAKNSALKKKSKATVIENSRRYGYVRKAIVVQEADKVRSLPRIANQRPRDHKTSKSVMNKCLP